MAVVSPGGCGDWSDARHSGEVGVAGEALGAGSLPNQDRDGERTAAGLGEQLGAVKTDEIA